MASHFSSVGFTVPDQDDFVSVIMRAAENGDATDVDGGRLVTWHAGAGVELWVKIAESGEIVGCDPHFSGRGRMRVALTAPILEPDEDSLGGCFHGWANPPDTGEENGGYPFVFNVPDYAAFRDLPLPTTRTVQLASFAHEIAGYANDEAFDYESRTLSAEGTEPQISFGAESFIPSGLFTTDDSTPQPLAFFHGHVLDTATITNPATGSAFLWALVRTLGGEVDVVIDPTVLTGTLTLGGVIGGSFYLSGRIVL